MSKVYIVEMSNPDGNPDSLIGCFSNLKIVHQHINKFQEEDNKTPYPLVAKEFKGKSGWCFKSAVFYVESTFETSITVKMIELNETLLG